MGNSSNKNTEPADIKGHMTVEAFQQLTALDGMRGRLQRHVLSAWLRYVHTKHKADAGVLPADVRLALPQLDVGVPELQDPGAVDSARRRRKRRGDTVCER